MSHPFVSKKMPGRKDKTPPAVPTGVSTEIVANGIRVFWTANTENDLAGYIVYGSNTNGGPYTEFGRPVGSSTVDTSAVPGTARYYVVRARDTAGNMSANSSQVTNTIPVDTTPPAAPTSFDVTRDSFNATITWTDDNPADFAGTRVYRNQTGTFDDTSNPISGLLTTETYTDTPPLTDTIYYYAARSFDQRGNASAFSSVDTVNISTTDTLLPPTLVTSENRDASVFVSWSDATGTITGYNIYRSTTGINGTYTKQNGSVLINDQYTDTTLAEDTIAWYYVKSVNGASESIASNKTAGHKLGTFNVTETYTASQDGFWTEGTQAIATSAAGSTDWKFGRQSANPRNGWVYFPTVNLDAGATITDAKLRLQARGDTVTTVVNTQISAVDGTSLTPPATYTEMENPAAGRTTARVSWLAIPTWTTNTVHESPNIATILNERTADPTWFNGAPLLIYVEDHPTTPSTNGAARAAQSAKTTFKQQLIISWAGVGDTVAPTTPSNLVGTPDEGGNILTWDLNVENDLAGYNVYRRATSGGARLQVNTGGLLVTGQFNDAFNLTDGTTYFYTIEAVDESGNVSAETAEVSVLTDLGDAPPPPPPPDTTDAYETPLPLMTVGTYNDISMCYEIPGMSSSASMGPWFLHPTGVIAQNATSITLAESLPIPLADNSEIVWFDPVAPTIVKTKLNGAHIAGVTNLTVDAIPASIPATADAYITGLQYRPTSDASTWHFAVEGERFDDGVMRGFVANIVELSDGTSYTIRCTVLDTLGTVDVNPREAVVSTVPDNAPTPTVLLTQVNKYVDAVAGNDTTGSGSSIAPWKTMSKLITEMNAAANGTNWVARVAGDHVLKDANLDLGSTKTLHIVAQNPRVANTGFTEQNGAVGTRSKITNGEVTGPTGSGAKYENVWTAVTGTGPLSGQALSNWYVYNAAVNATIWMGYSTSLTGEIKQLAEWQAHSSQAGNVNGSLDWVQNVDTTNYGWGRVGSSPIYLRLPPYVGATNPNTIYIWMGTDALLNVTATGNPVNGATFRLCGFELAGARNGIRTKHSKFTYIDHNLMTCMRFGIANDSIGSPTFTFGRHEVARHNIMRSHHLRAPGGTGEQPQNSQLAWQAVKGYSTYTSPGGTVYSRQRSFQNSEGSAFKGEGVGWGRVIQYNHVQSWFNGYGDGQGTAFPSASMGRFAGFGLSATDNIFEDIADDGTNELESNAMCQKIGRNTIKYASTCSTSAPAAYGPQTFWRNRFWNIGNREVGIPRGQVGALMSKMGASGTGSQNPQHWFHNTYWSNQPYSKGWHKTNPGAGELPRHVAYNNIIRCVHQVARNGLWVGDWREDHNVFVATPDGTNDSGVVDSGYRNAPISKGKEILYRTLDDLLLYRSSFPNTGVYTNKVGVGGVDISFIDSARVDALLTAPASGDVTLKANADGTGVNPAKDRGRWIPNISESGYSGNAPSVGAVEG